MQSSFAVFVFSFLDVFIIAEKRVENNNRRRKVKKVAAHIARCFYDSFPSEIFIERFCEVNCEQKSFKGRIDKKLCRDLKGIQLN